MVDPVTSGAGAGERLGGGDPSRVVLLHGGALDGRSWDAVADNLRERGPVTVVAPTRPSRADILEALVPDAVLVGASLGGGIALDVASHRPPGLTQVVAVGPLVPGSPAPIDEARAATLRTAAAQGPSAFAAAALADTWFSAGLPDTHRGWLGTLLEVNAPGAPGRSSWVEPDHDLARRLRRIDVPVTVLVGAEDDDYNQTTSRWVADNVPNSSFHVVPGAGHLVEVVQPAAVAQAVRGEIGRWPIVTDLLEAQLDAYLIAAAHLDGQLSPGIAGWTVDDTTAHLAHTFRRFHRCLLASRAGDLTPPFAVGQLDAANAAALQVPLRDPRRQLAEAAHEFIAANPRPEQVMAHQRGPISVGLQQAFGLSELALHLHDISPGARPDPAVVEIVRRVWVEVIARRPLVGRDEWAAVLRASGRR